MPPEEYSHIIIPDTKVVDDYLELFELPDLKNIVFAQTTVQFVSTTNKNSIKRSILFINRTIMTAIWSSILLPILFEIAIFLWIIFSSLI